MRRTKPSGTLPRLTLALLLGLLMVCGDMATSLAQQPIAPTPYRTDFEGAWTNKGGSNRSVPDQYWSQEVYTSDSSWRRYDEATGGNSASWNNPTNGNFLNVPTSTDASAPFNGNHCARFHSYAWLRRRRDFNGYMDLHVNLNGPGRKLLSFDYVNEEFTDSKLTVQFSADSGRTFRNVTGLTNLGQQRPWRHYGKRLLTTARTAHGVIRFIATADGFCSYDLGIDNVSVYAQADLDLGIDSLMPPLAGCNMTNNERHGLRVYNNGTDTVDTFIVAYSVNNGPPRMDTVVQRLLPNAQHSHTFSQGIDLTQPGDYTLRTWVMLQGDTTDFNDSANPTTITIAPLINTYPYREDFDLSRGGWSSEGGNTPWVWGYPNKSTINTTSTGVGNCWNTSALTGDYSLRDNAFLYSPCFDFTNLKNPILQFRIWWELEGNRAGCIMQVTTDNGATWNTVGGMNAPAEWNWYNATNIFADLEGQRQSVGWSGHQVNPPSTFPRPDASNNNGVEGWVTARNQVARLAGEPSVRFRFAMFAGTWGNLHDGVAIDDFEIKEGPSFEIGVDTSFCFGDSVLVSAPAGYRSYRWNNFAQTQSTFIKGAGYFWVVATDSSGFTAIDSILSIVSEPKFDIGPRDTTVCEGTPIIMDGTVFKASRYQWNDGVSDPRRTVDTAGNYCLTVIDSVGCRVTKCTRINHAVVPKPQIGNDTSFCSGGVLLLDAGQWQFGSTYDWSTGVSSRQILITAPGVYTVRVTTPLGCTGSDAINVRVDNSPFVDLGPDVYECDSLDAILDAQNPGANYKWYKFGDPSILTRNRMIVANEPGTYWVEVLAGNGCVGYDTISVGVNPLPFNNLGENRGVCGDEFLDAGAGAGAYLWSTGDTTRTIRIFQTGRYNVQVTDLFGCIAMDTVFLTVYDDPVPDFALPDTVNAQDTLWLTDATLPVPDERRWVIIYTPTGGETDTIIKALSNTYWIPPQPGQLTVRLMTEKTPCQSEIEKSSVVEEAVLSRELETDPALTFQAYPNPTSGYVNVRASFATPHALSLQVLDLNGRVLTQQLAAPAATHAHTLDLDELPTGIYVLRATYGEHTVTERILKR